MYPCRLQRNAEDWVVMVEDVDSRHSPRMCRDVPYTRSAGEQSGSSRQAVPSPRSTNGSSRMCGTCFEGGLKLAMKPLNHAVCLRVVGRRPAVLGPEELIEVSPEVQEILRAPVGCYVLRVPNRAIQLRMRARAHVSVLLSGIGIASGQCVKRSTTVKR